MAALQRVPCIDVPMPHRGGRWDEARRVRDEGPCHNGRDSPNRSRGGCGELRPRASESAVWHEHDEGRHKQSDARESLQGRERKRGGNRRVLREEYKRHTKETD